MKVLTTGAMSELERRAIEEFGIPGILLMENAANGVVDAALDRFPTAKSAIVFCGPGNNGGDGLAVARLLTARGLGVLALVATEGREYSGDARIQFEAVRQGSGSGLDLQILEPGSDISEIVARLSAADLVVDALFGTGLSRPLSGSFADLTAGINRLRAPVVSVDLPSGLHGDRAEPPGPHVVADLTVTFAFLKTAHVLEPACEAVGEVIITGLGIPERLLDEASAELFLLEADDVSESLEPRPREAHKGDFGHLLVVAGSLGKSGAAVLAARAAVRSGAGLVTAAVPEPIVGVVEAASLETMTSVLPASASGEISADALGPLERQAVGKQAIALGPGLGGSEGAAEVIRVFCLSSSVPLVLDADGLNAFAGRLSDLQAREGSTVLTPHPGELGRLLGTSTAEVVRTRLASVRRAAQEAGAVVILKGRATLIADPRGAVYVNPTGNPGMATGGTGDVLTGVIGALLAQGASALEAARLGAYVHGLAGDRAASALGERSLAAGDLLDSLPGAFEELSERRNGALCSVDTP